MSFIQSSVRTELFRTALWRGTFLASLGALLLLYGGTQASSEFLSLWGIPMLLLALGLITAGLLPYRRLTRLELNPYQLQVGEEALCFYSKGKALFTVPRTAIKHLSHHEADGLYGIKIELDEHPEEKVSIHSSTLDMDKLQRNSRRRYGCDLFLQWFSRRAFNILLSQLEQREEED